MGRKNADTLVAAPQDGHRNYNAGQSRGVDLETLQFRKRARLGHYSLYVKGCRFDKVEKVAQVSQAGAIPASWLELAGWSQANRSQDPGDPPDEFWRTIVADRGTNDRNPPYYYMRACKETIMKGGLRSNAVDTGALIHNERNSIVAEFCRRVQAVIWNRALIKTRSGTLGLVSERVKAGDWICIIYGCTVPVILRKEGWKTEKELEDEKIEDCIETWAKHIRSAAKQRARKARYDVKRAKNSTWEAEIQRDLAEYQSKLEDLREKEMAKYEQKLNILRNGAPDEQTLNGSRLSDTFRDANEDRSDEDSDTSHNRDMYATGEDAPGKHAQQAGDYRTDTQASNTWKHHTFGSNGAKPQSSDVQKYETIKTHQPTAHPMHPSTTDEGQMEDVPAPVKPGHIPLPGSNILREADQQININPPARNSLPAGKISRMESNTSIRSSFRLLNRAQSANQSPRLASSKLTADVPNDDTDEDRSENEQDEKEGKPKGQRSESAERKRDKKRQEAAKRKDPFRYYSFLGEAYIHGMMDGEAIRQNFQKAKPDHIFEIR